MARKTKLESARTRERILDAAEIEMQHRGVARTSLERIARRAEVTRGAVYWHFDDKSALIEAMVARTHLPLRDLRQSLSVRIPDNEPLRLLREMLLHGLYRLGADDQHRRVCHIILHRCEITDHGHSVEALLGAMFEDARADLMSLCVEIERRDQLRAGLTATDAADTIIAFMCGNYECTLRHPDLYNVRRDWRPIIDAMLLGLFHVNKRLAKNTRGAGKRVSLNDVPDLSN